tara:strand:+ start:3698 stop:3916 length:219 start_codon:yes stop_codon:yes gene_type:complete
MKNKDINKLSATELKRKIISLKKDLFNFRFRKVNGQLEDTAKVSSIKKDIAKINTKLNKTTEKENEQKNIKR